MKGKQNTSLEEWREIGRILKTTRTHILKEIKSHKKSSKQARWLRSALKGIDHAKDKLDNLLFEEFPDLTLHEAASVFYGLPDEVKE